MSLQNEMKVDIRPDVAALRIFRNISFTSWYALGEFVDNSISSAIKNSDHLKKLNGPDYELRVTIDFDKKHNTLTIEDNAAGIATHEIERALRTGQPPEDVETGLNKHGVGMKAAALWWGQAFTIETYPLGEEMGWKARIDISAEGDINHLVDVVPIPWRGFPGTKIFIENLWQKTPVSKTVTAIRSYLPSIYRTYLSPDFGSKEFKCTIIYDGKPLKFDAPELLFEPYWPDKHGPVIGAEPKLWKLDVDILLSTGKRVTGWVGLLSNTSRFYNSFFLHYRGKGIAGAVPTDELIFSRGNKADSEEAKTAIAKSAYRPSSIFGAPGNYPGIKYIGEFDMTDFGKTITTDSPLWSPSEEEEFVEALKELMTENDFPKMGRHYRSPKDKKDKLEEIDELNDVLEESKLIQKSLDGQINHITEFDDVYSSFSSEEISGNISERDQIEFTLKDDDGSESHTFVIRMIRDKSQPFIDVIEDFEDSKSLIRLNEYHTGLQFISMNREARKLFRRIGFVLGAAEVLSTQAGKSKMRLKANDLLGKLGHLDLE